MNDGKHGSQLLALSFYIITAPGKKQAPRAGPRAVALPL